MSAQPAKHSAPRLPAWARTIRFQVALGLGVLFVMLAGSIGFTLYELNLRRHDYEILNLAGQLRVTSHAMTQQARNYLRDTPTDYEAYYRDLRLFYEDLQRQVALYDRIIGSFQARRLDPALTGKHDAITCNWDARSRNQLRLTADDWRLFRRGLVERLGEGEPRLNYGAEYIVAHGDRLTDSTGKLAHAFQTMMEDKLAMIRLFNQGAMAVAALIMLALVVMLYVRLVRPLRLAMAGFERVARGDLGHQLPVGGDDEIGQMTAAFNQLSERLNALFRLTDRINLGNKLDDTLGFVLEEFRAFLPVDWVGLFLAAPDGERLVLERQRGEGGLRTGLDLPLYDPDLDKSFRSASPLNLLDLAQHCQRSPASKLATLLRDAGHGAAMLLPCSGTAGGQGLLVFASRLKGAYVPEHAEFLQNVAGQLAHALDKTFFLEGLVVAAVQGLAKLAESRDPETGDHLVRMALYAALVAEELGRRGPYQEQISAAYVREIHQFAPMHDIGKVGIADHILLKPGRHSDEERRDMQRHPLIGGEVLRRCEAQVNALGYSIFQVAIEIAEGHHEKFDGSGYPQGLAGQDIPLSARIVAVADVFDALTCKRPYKEAWPVERALATLDEESGRHFDPQVVVAFHATLPRVMEIYERLKHV